MIGTFLSASRMLDVGSPGHCCGLRSGQRTCIPRLVWCPADTRARSATDRATWCTEHWGARGESLSQGVVIMAAQAVAPGVGFDASLGALWDQAIATHWR